MSATAKPYKLSRYGEHKGSYSTLEAALKGSEGLAVFYGSTSGIVIDEPMNWTFEPTDEEIAAKEAEADNDPVSPFNLCAPYND